MFWEIYQQRGINSAQASASRAEHKAARVHESIAVLEDRIDSLSLVCQAMWEIVSGSLPNAEQLLADKVAEVDLRDGNLDGKLTRVGRKCPQCSRPLHRRHKRCLYCGETLEAENIFQK